MDMDGINNLIERERDLYGLAYKKGLSVAFICRTLALTAGNEIIGCCASIPAGVQR